MRPLFFALALLATAAPAVCASDWHLQMPAAARSRVNPIPQDATAVAAGAKLFRQSCASCHGADAAGRGTRPSLRTVRVHSATDGELEWLLTNGELRRGMPAWSQLPASERWQLVRYLHSLPAAQP